MSDTPLLRKVILLGQSAVGKSCLAERFARDQFYPYSNSTIGASFFTKNLNINGRIVKLDIWDTAGQERYHALAPMYYRGAHGVLLVYDITDPESYQKAKLWIRELQTSRLLNEGYPIIYLVGNKVDLEESRQIPLGTLQSEAQDHEINAMEVSAKTGFNVIDLFHELAEKMVRTHDLQREANPNNRNEVIIAITEQETRPSGSCC